MKLLPLFSLPLYTLAQVQQPAHFNPSNIGPLSVSFSGTGCPQGSVAASISPSRDVVTLSFDRFAVYYGPGYSTAAKQRNCGVKFSFNVTGETGWQFVPVETTFHGYAALDKGVTAQMYAAFLDSYTEGVSSTKVVLEGGKDLSAAGDVFTKSVNVVPWPPTIPTSRCVSGNMSYNMGTDVTMNLRVAVMSRNSTTTGSFFGEDESGERNIFTVQVRLLWKECKNLGGFWG
ncbi:hypothetical protein QBC35DRAFT_465755 [Podospora australis]|uniref:Secreted protein n=1 Tax=Podospora australis TaxID=1536484 RepID=A0AAN6WRU5_9PEZI|nr:hypothetical protein QBC35DRAFT_465755 [Podospora australis]